MSPASKRLPPRADYLTVNVSSPNTPGLRILILQEPGGVGGELKAVMEARNAEKKKPPVFVKIAPDQTDQQQEDIASAVLESGVEGMIVGNTTVTRLALFRRTWRRRLESFSGPEMMAPTRQKTARQYVQADAGRNSAHRKLLEFSRARMPTPRSGLARRCDANIYGAYLRRARRGATHQARSGSPSASRRLRFSSRSRRSRSSRI